MTDLKLQKLLLIEDYPAMSTAVKTMLFSMHITNIVEVDTGISAINALKNQHFDIILCDYTLGKGKNGLQILDEIREHKLLSPHSAFIIITAEKMQSMVLSLMENKPDAYLSKPFTSQLLLTRIQSTFEKKNFFANIDTAIFEKNYPLAIEYCDALLNKNVQKMRKPLLRQRAELAIYMLDYQTAYNIYNQALKEHELDWAMLGLANTLYHQKKYIETVKLLNELIKKFPITIAAYDLLAQAYEALNEHEKAQSILNSAIKLSPNIITRQRKLADIAQKTGDWHTAEIAGKSVLSLGRFSVHRKAIDFSNLAHTLESSHKSTEALEILNTLRKEFPNNSAVKLLASISETEILHNLGEIENAEKSFETVLSLKEHEQKLEKTTKLTMAKVCHINHQEKLADHILEDLIKNNIDDEGFINEINDMNISIGLANQSEQLIAHTRKELVAINNKAIHLFKKGNIKAAVEIFSIAFKKMPENKTIILNMIKILIHQMQQSDINKERMKVLRFYIDKAKATQVAQEKLDSIQMEYAKLMHKFQKRAK